MQRYILSFDGEVVTPEMVKSGKINIADMLARNSKDLRFPEIERLVRSLKQEHGFKKIGAIGFCWGGWAVFQLGAKGSLPFPFIPPNTPSLLPVLPTYRTHHQHKLPSFVNLTQHTG